MRAADHVDLDPGCVLYGAIELTPLDIAMTLGGLAIPRAAIVLATVLLINTVIIIAFFKELRISAFDPALATTMGINATFMHYLLMAMVAVTTVASFEAVGSIIVIAMLIVPAATAYLLTDRLSVMLVISVVVAILSPALGHLGALTVPRLFGFESTNTSGMMAAATGLLFGITWLLSPRYGLLSRWLHRKNRHRDTATLAGT